MSMRARSELLAFSRNRSRRTVLGDLLQSIEMKRHGEIQNFHPRGIARSSQLWLEKNS